MNKKLAILLFLFACCLAAGCQKSSRSFRQLSYEFAHETRDNQIELRATLKSDDISNVSMSSSWGFIDWMKEEGSEVASGEVVVRINMEDALGRLRNREKQLADENDHRNNMQVSVPAEMADLNRNRREKELEFALAAQEENWLKQPKTADEIWKIHADLQIAQAGFQHAGKIFAMQKTVTDKGFDSPFALRSSEIDLRSREIELDYARRIVGNLTKDPLPEDIARLTYQKEVASGEIWLAQNQLQAASISSQIRSKNFEVVMERINSVIRETRKSLEDIALRAPRAGTVIHPFVWGDFKFRPGAQAWSGATILQVIGNGRFYLESMAAEADANMLFEKASATITFDSLPDRQFPGEIRTISKSPRANHSQGASNMRFFPVQISCEPDHKILLGSKAVVKVNLGSRSGIFVPRQALHKSGEQLLLKVKGAFSETMAVAEIEDFNQDWVVWKNAPASTGVNLFP
jgi:multidrug resistance efflux pump